MFEPRSSLNRKKSITFYDDEEENKLKKFKTFNVKKIKKDKERKPINEKKKKNTIAKIKYFKENKIDANFIRKNQQRERKRRN